MYYKAICEKGLSFFYNKPRKKPLFMPKTAKYIKGEALHSRKCWASGGGG
jgi:hypothetical protein